MILVKFNNVGPETFNPDKIVVNPLTNNVDNKEVALFVNNVDFNTTAPETDNVDTTETTFSISVLLILLISPATTRLPKIVNEEPTVIWLFIWTLPWTAKSDNNVELPDTKIDCAIRFEFNKVKPVTVKPDNNVVLLLTTKVEFKTDDPDTVNEELNVVFFNPNIVEFKIAAPDTLRYDAVLIVPATNNDDCIDFV